MTLWQLDWKSKGRSQATLKSMTSEVNRFEAWMGKPLLTATHVDCLTYIVKRREDKSTLASEYTWRSLRSFYEYASDLDDTPNPMAKIKCPRRAEAAVKAVTADEYAKLLAACKTKEYALYAERDRAMISLLWCTGLRRSELANLTLDDVDIAQGALVVRVSKTGKPRVVPFSEEAKIALLKYLRVRGKHTYAALPQLWIGTKGPLGGDGVRLMMERRSALAGVNVSCHQFRRHFAAAWLSAGGSQVSLQSICGWNSAAMPARYTRHAAGAVALDEHRRLFK